MPEDLAYHPWVILEEDAGSSAAPTSSAPRTLSVVDMTHKLLLILIVAGLVVLAVAGWTVDGLKWLAGGGSGSRAAEPAAA